MKAFIIIIILLTSAMYNATAQIEKKDEAPLIKVKEGIIRGLKEVSENGKPFHSYYGIPFAEPPVNKLRFKDPVPKSPWKGYYDGTKVPQGCSQHTYSESILPNAKDFPVSGKEDCLTLNVFTPESNSPKAKRPVMVYIYGGGFYAGSSDEFVPYVLMDEEIVLVVIQYRLGILGFLSTEDEILPGNMGLKDQQLALKWVKENIECFGGDPNLVTIFGESAGGVSVNFHLLSPGSKGLFQRVIMQSGAAICPFAYHTNSLKNAKAAGIHFNCSLDRGTQKYLECMQSVGFRELVSFATSLTSWGAYPLPYLPRVDGDFLPNKPEVLLKNGNYTKVDTIAGVTRHEGGAYIIGMAVNPTLLENLNQNFHEFGPISLILQEENNPLDLALQMYERYLNKTSNFTSKDYENFEQLYSDRTFHVCGFITEKFLANDPDVNSYLYQMDHFGSVSDGVGVPGYDRRNWVIHQDDLHYLFGGGGPRFNKSLSEESDVKVRRFFVSAWTNFAKYGNPNVNYLPCNCSWEEATESNFRYLSIKEYPEMKEFNFPEVRDFWLKLKTEQNAILLS